MSSFIFTKTKKKASELKGEDLANFHANCEELKKEIEVLYDKTSEQDYIEVNNEKKPCVIL